MGLGHSAKPRQPAGGVMILGASDRAAFSISSFSSTVLTSEIRRSLASKRVLVHLNTLLRPAHTMLR
jgi:hypothetical protein